MLAVEKAHPIKLLMFGEGLEYVKAVLKKNIPDIVFEDEVSSDASDEEVISSEDSEVLNNIPLTPADVLLIRRENAGLTQKQLSEKTGIAVPNISLMESGQRAIGAKTARKLAEALNCDAGDFI
ncbi:MAG: helix-turn-helix transcriptional regulator [Treponema sp.]|nr:helix-turn-helix transcriptional regulator [Spirochaetia bacterium]MDD7458779.1 helix-turn-helix transcriptional regulator [Spirochaetales bacterium]MDY5811551.1 helix-turn-helix transcriptional regulator [Treponema sp.]